MQETMRDTKEEQSRRTSLADIFCLLGDLSRLLGTPLSDIMWGGSSLSAQFLDLGNPQIISSLFAR
jgi:hypothetical protein